MRKDKRKSNKKIVSAAAMLLLSASMLGTATFAWFTMSREVEVQNIQLTATTPEDMQLSLGLIGNSSDTVCLAKSSGFLTNTNGVVTEPGDDVYSWSNTADVSAYYGFGKLIPASSTTGANIYFTPDADGVGKTVKSDAKYYTAATADTAAAESTVGAGTGNLNTTAHPYADATDRSTTWKNTTYTKSTAWNITNDDGYYVDIPVWLRTSGEVTGVSVKAYVVDVADQNATDPLAVANSGSDDGEMLYRAVRVAVLNEDGTTTSLPLPVADGDSAAAATDKYAGTSILNYYDRVAGQDAVSAVASNAATYAAVTAYNGTTAIANIPAGTGTGYGTPVKLIVRVWLEGEDPDCWNATAGQDWSINLKFEKANPLP